MASTPLDNLKEYLKSDKVIPVIGAGVSYAAANLPGWKGTVQDGLDYAKNRHLDMQSIQQAERYLADNQITEAANILKQLLGAPGKQFAKWAYELFGDVTIRSTDLLSAINDLCAPIILTTNYDQLLYSQGLIKNKSSFDWTQYQIVAEALRRNKQFVFHLHGIVTNPASIILCKADYSMLANQKGYKKILEELWSNYHFLFIGCSKDGVMDEDFTTVFDFLNEWFPLRTHEHFILMRESDVQLGIHKPLIDKCNIEPVVFGKNYNELADYIKKINPNLQKAALLAQKEQQEFDKITKRLKHLSGHVATDPSLVTQIVNEILPAEFNWIDSPTLNRMEISFEKLNKDISNIKEKFKFYQNVIQAFVNRNELKGSIDLWKENRDSPEKVNNETFISLAILAYHVLGRLPSDLLEEIRHRDWRLIHEYYFDGTLGQFITEYQMYRQQGQVNLKSHYGDDKYFFENLKRIMTSLQNVLELDADIFFQPVQKAIITKDIPREHLVFVYESEVSVRKSSQPFEKVASLTTEPGLPFRNVINCSFQNNMMLIGHTSQRCFYWDPTKDLVPNYFYAAEKDKTIKKIFIDNLMTQPFIYIHTSDTILKSTNFETPVKIIDLPFQVEDIIYHSQTKQFFFTLNQTNRYSELLWKINVDGNLKIVIRKDRIWDIVKDTRFVQEDLKKLYAHYHSTVPLDELKYKIKAVDTFLVNWNNKQLLTLKIRFDLFFSNVLFVLAEVGEDKSIEIISTLVTDRLASHIDYIDIDENLNLIMGFRSTGDETKKLVHLIRNVNNQPVIEVEDEEGFISTSGATAEDIDLVRGIKKNTVAVIQHAGHLYELNVATGKVIKLSEPGLLDILPK